MPTRRLNEGDPEDGALRLPTGIQTTVNPTGQDPTARTTQQVLRENFWLRELLEARLAGMDKALQLLQAFADRTPTTMDVQYQVQQLREVVMEMFKQRDTAVSAAFAAAKEAVLEQNRSSTLAIGKSETSVIEQLRTMNETSKMNTKNLEDKIADIKDRLTVIESKTSVSDPTTQITLAKLDATVQRLTHQGDIGTGRTTGQAALWALIVGAIGLVIGIASAVGLIMRVVSSSGA